MKCPVTKGGLQERYFKIKLHWAAFKYYLHKKPLHETLTCT